MVTNQLKPGIPFLCAAFLYLLFFHQLGRLGLVGPDEPRYAKVAKEMVASGDFVTPRLNGQPWFEKPILYYWVAALGFKVLGVSEFAARLPSALAGLLGCLTVFWIGTHWRSRQTGFIAALVLASAPMYFSLARAASTDMLLTASLAAAMACFYVALAGDSAKKQAADRRANTPLVLGFYAFSALAILAKGPVGIVLPGFILAIFIGITGQRGLLRRLRLLEGAVLCACIALPWYLLCYRANGWPFVQEFLLSHNLARFVTERFQHVQPFWFYVPVVLAGFFPWSFQLFSAAWHFMRRDWKASRDDHELFLWIWALVPFLFFSLSQSKLPGYALPMLPALALIVAREWERLWEPATVQTHRSILLFQPGFIFLLGLALPFFVGKLNIELSPFLVPLTTLLCGIGGYGLLLALKGQTRTLFGLYLTGVGLMVVLILHSIVPRLDPQESARHLATVLKQQSFAGEPIFLYRLSRRLEYGLNFYLDTATHIIYSEDDAKYPRVGAFYLVTEPSVLPESVLPGAKIESELILAEQRIARMSRR